MLKLKLVELLKEYKSQFSHNETFIWDHTTDQHDNRYQSFRASFTETIFNSDKTLQMG